MKPILSTTVAAFVFLGSAWPSAAETTRARLVSDSAGRPLPSLKLKAQAGLKPGQLTPAAIRAIPLGPEFAHFPVLQLSPEALERNRVKRWEITPRRPYTPGLEMLFIGGLTRDTFIVEPVLRSDLASIGHLGFQAYTLTLLGFAPGKDYKLTLEFAEPRTLPAHGALPLITPTGSSVVLAIHSGQGSVSALFTSTPSGYQLVSLGPILVNNDTSSPKAYSLSKIIVEELASAG
jgi:hypothetical protein